MASDLSHPTCAALFCHCFSLRFWNRGLHDPRPPPRPTHADRQLAQTPHDRRCEASALLAFAARSRDGRVWCLVHVRQNRPACPRIIATPSSRRMYITCWATAVVLGMRPEQARVAMRVASDFTIVNADSPSSDFVPIHEKDTANNGICVLCFFLSETFVTSKAQS